MRAGTSTHKRKRSAVRADRARGAPGGSGRLVANVYDADGADHAFDAAIDAHPFQHAVDIVLPSRTTGTPASIDHVRASLVDTVKGAGSGPCLARVPLTLFLDPHFVASYIRSGSLYALSATRLDAEDSVCLDGQGLLVLSLTKDTYQTLGLVGRPSRFSYGASGRMGDRKSGPVSRYIVELPLLAPSFVPGKKGFERARQCLESWDAARANVLDGERGASFRSGASFSSHASMPPDTKSSAADRPSAARATWDMFFVWVPPRTCGASLRIWAPIAFPDALVCRRDVRMLHTSVDAEDVTDVWVPSMVASHGDGEGQTRRGTVDDRAHSTGVETQEDDNFVPPTPTDAAAMHVPAALVHRTERGLPSTFTAALLEWSGLAAYASPRLHTYDRCEPAVASYAPPLGSTPGSFIRIRIAGFLPPSLVRALVHTVWNSDAHGGLPWASFAVSGFADAPVAWCSRHPGLGLALGSGESLAGTAQTRAPRAVGARAKRRKGHVRTGESEHGLLRTGENGWTAYLLPRELCGQTGSARRSAAVFESVELDTHN
ncbi:ribonuclease P [Malassezia sp. CBS 17886]|nr:ribonuclease P [Malassezia sp. CBS 17886]